MNVDQKTVDYVAKLSRIHLEDSEKEKFAEQLDKIVGHIAKLNELNTDGVEPLAHPLGTTNVFRSDEGGSSLSVEKALENAPKSADGYFSVPAVID